MGLIAYLPQRDWEIFATALGASIVAIGAVHAVSGRASGEQWRPRTVRAIGAAQILLGLGIVAAGFLLNAGHGQVGGKWGFVFVAVWLAMLAVGVAWISRKYRK